MSDKKIIKNTSMTSKTFAYSLGAVNISVNLRTDIRQELKDGAEILTQILKDINEEIKK